MNLHDLLWVSKFGGNTSGSTGGSGGDSTENWIGDGNTHIWISLAEGRTSPMLGVCPNGTVTVDWGDGSEPDVLTGTSTSNVVWTPNHNYASAGDYMITLTVDGEMGVNGAAYTNTGSYILRHSSVGNDINYVYRNSVRKVEIGDGVTSIGNNAFYYCHSLTSITIPDGVTSIGNYAFNYCCSLTSITIPDGVTRIGSYAFYNCFSLTSITIPDGVTSVGNSAFYNCFSLTSITIPDGITSIAENVLYSCHSLTSITIPDGVTSIGRTAFFECGSLAKLRFEATVPPTASIASLFNYVPKDCIISVPVGSLEAYKTATYYPSANTYTYIEED